MGNFGLERPAGGGGGGDVTAGSNITDNSVVRGDGGAKGIQGSGILVDDSDNVTLPDGASLTLQENINFVGATGENQIIIPDNVNDALSIVDDGGGGTLFAIKTADGFEQVESLSDFKASAALTVVGATTLATSLTGVLRADSGVVSIGASGGLTGSDIKTIGSGGDYTDVAAFIADNSTPYHGVLVADVTEDSDIPVDGSLYLNLDRYTLTLGTNSFTYAAEANVTLRGAGFDLAQIDWTHTSGSTAVFENNSFDSSIVDVSGITMDNNSTSAISIWSYGVDIVDNVRLELPNLASCGFNPDGDGHNYSRVRIVGGGTSCHTVVRFENNIVASLSDFLFTGTFSTSASINHICYLTNMVVANNWMMDHSTNPVTIACRGAMMNNIKTTGGQDLDMLTETNNDAHLSNIWLGAGTFKDDRIRTRVTNLYAGELILGSTGRSAWANVTIHTTAVTVGHDNALFTNCFFLGGASVSSGSDRTQFNNCHFGAINGGGALTLTIDSGANNTVVTGCITDGDISDSGTTSVLIGNLTI